MSDLSKKIQQSVVNSVVKPSETNTTYALVTKSDEINNMVSIKYLNKYGNRVERNNVSVRLYSRDSSDFPSENDTVEIQETDNDVIVIARAVGNYGMDVRSKMVLKQDKLHDSLYQNIGGFIM
jgi:thymidine phosphorylase